MPKSASALYWLSRLPHDQILAFLADGRIHAQLTARAAKALVHNCCPDSEPIHMMIIRRRFSRLIQFVQKQHQQWNNEQCTVAKTLGLRLAQLLTPLP
jgi:hypothetical protein